MRLQEIKLLESSVKEVFGNRDHTEEFCDFSDSNLTSLEGSPKHVTDDFTCHGNKLKSLVGGPEYVGRDFYCQENELTSLEGAPSYIGEDFFCFRNDLTSLHNIHKQINHIGGKANFNGNEIKSHVLGLLLIGGLKGALFDDKELQDIINKHLYRDRDVFACQEELIEHGFEDFAQL